MVDFCFFMKCPKSVIVWIERLLYKKRSRSSTSKFQFCFYQIVSAHSYMSLYTTLNNILLTDKHMPIFNVVKENKQRTSYNITTNRFRHYNRMLWPCFDLVMICWILCFVKWSLSSCKIVNTKIYHVLSTKTKIGIIQENIDVYLDAIEFMILFRNLNNRAYYWPQLLILSSF